ncbi:PTS glucitol/sorbitol transporter subunit IIA [Anaerosinus massiliensis]|uniref:PTS glucitol/sorbitol transporter subunit IIA n=1 Tax=Massilibacillus massiliensis TaxID=1806837 RepID=UPI000DA61BCB|nr:PTS glucitol/sorbitol transporter subunit IIA [Massilibacillus massiliensis]
MKYEVMVTNIGDFVLQYIKVRDSIIIFDKDVPYHYADMVVAHTIGKLKADVTVGDKLTIAEQEYNVTAVGDEANQTLREHGHCTLVFNGSDTVEQPGQIAVTKGAVPRLMVGDTIRFD